MLNDFFKKKNYILTLFNFYWITVFKFKALCPKQNILRKFPSQKVPLN